MTDGTVPPRLSHHGDDALASDLSSQFTYGLVQDGVNGLAGDVRRGSEYEGAIRKSTMRNAEPLLFDHPIPVKQDVEVQRPGAVALQADAARVEFDREQQIEERAGRVALGVHRCGRIEEVLLADGSAPGLGHPDP